MKKATIVLFALALVASLAPVATFAVPDCPSTFSVCADVQGKSCRLETGSACTTDNTHHGSCRLPDNSIFSCPGQQTVHTVNCGCTTRLQMDCCDNCGTFVCGSCEAQPGAQSLICA